MRIVTWNVAGLNARLHRVKLWIEENQPDVLCLQETKMEDEVFEKNNRINHILNFYKVEDKSFKKVF